MVVYGDSTEETIRQLGSRSEMGERTKGVVPGKVSEDLGGLKCRVSSLETGSQVMCTLFRYQ